MKIESFPARACLMGLGLSSGFFCIEVAAAQQAADSTVVVTGAIERQQLDADTEAGSRLGLTIRETPASIDLLTEAEILELGARTTVEALNRAPGLTSSYAATSPGNLSLRGFVGNGVSLIYDGSRSISTGFFTRIQDSWTFDRIEVLKGPASVLHGDGALAGAVNLVPKRADAEELRGQGLLSFGSFDAARGAVDLNVPLGEDAAVRGVLSHSTESGYIEDSDVETNAATISFVSQLSDRLKLDIGLDYSDDDYRTAYFGTPLVPRALARNPTDVVSTPDGLVIDEALREANLNVENGVAASDTQWLRTGLTYEISDDWSLMNTLNYYHSDRNWVNAEIFGFAPTTGLVNRSTGIVTHDIDFWLNRLQLNGDFRLGGLRNRLVVGAEYSALDFYSLRRFGNTTAVNPYNLVRGRFPVGDTPAIFGTRQETSSDIKTTAFFVENALNLTSRWLLVAGARTETIDFDRTLLDNTSGVRTPIIREYGPTSWRVGTVFDITPKTQVFAQYSSAFVPVGSLVLLSLANSQFDVSTGTSLEGGLKSTLFSDRVDVTLSYYDIEQDDIITRDPNNPTLSIQGGTQSSRGWEAAVSASLTPRLRIDANYTELDARFDRLFEAGGISREGRTPPRVPERIGNLFAVYEMESLPLTFTAGARSVGRFFTNNANTIRVEGYTTYDASIGYRFDFGDLTLRGRNLTDEIYGEPQDLSTGQITLGAPQSFDVTLTTRF